MLLFQDLPADLQTVVIHTIENETVKSPLFLFSVKVLEYNYLYFKHQLQLDDSEIFYSVKANHYPEVVSTLNQLGSHFEIASKGELDLLKRLEIPADKILVSSPVKMPSFLVECQEFGVNTFAFDCESELEKIAEFAPKSNVFLRLIISNKGAEWNLVNKFGASFNDATELFKVAKMLELNPVGISVHLGWNNANTSTWKQAINKLQKIIAKCQREKITLKFLNIGGGFPAHNCNQYEELERISEEISEQLNVIREKYKLRIVTEPGSFLVANCGVLITQIFDILTRTYNGSEKKWIFVNTGIFQGFVWIMGGINYNVLVPKELDEDTEFQEFVVTGPTNDSHDVFSAKCELPENIQIGDYLIVYPGGAYTFSSKNYNGFEFPNVLML